MSSLIAVKDLYKVYENGLIQSLNGITFTLESGKIYALMGASGCGKSTLLNIIGTLDSQTSGEVFYEGKHLSEVGELSVFRRNFIGFIFQFHHLIPVLTLRENIEAALLSNHNMSAEERKERAMLLLEEMGISHRADSFADKISGGERQRGAIARALANNPKVLLADEPTGNIDSKTSKLVLKKLRDYVDKMSGTILIATHDHNVSEIADVVINMEDGRIISIRDKDI
jgi:ABC-type lipoprotein export system ATPase subunit